jgi:hypothetical protein
MKEAIEPNPRSFNDPIDMIESSHAKTANGLAWLIVFLVFATFLLHLVTVFYLSAHRPDSVERVSKVFEIWVPIFSGVLGTSVGYYFGDKRRTR